MCDLNRRLTRKLRSRLCIANNVIAPPRNRSAARCFWSVDATSSACIHLKEHPLLPLPLGNLLQCLLHIWHSRHRDKAYIVNLKFPCEPGRHSTLDRQQRSLFRSFRFKSVIRAIHYFAELDMPFSQPEIKILKRKRHVKKRGMIFSFFLLRNARPDGNNCDVIAIKRAQHFAMCKHRRQNAAYMRKTIWMELPDEVHNRGASRRNPDSIGLAPHQGVHAR